MLIPEVNCLAFDEIYDSLTVTLQPDWDLEERCIVVQLGSEVRKTGHFKPINNAVYRQARHHYCYAKCDKINFIQSVHSI